MEIPPTLLLLYREKTNSLACARNSKLKSKSTGLELGSPRFQAQCCSALLLTLGSHFPQLGLSSSSKDGVIFSEPPSCNSIIFPFDRNTFDNV